MKSEPKLKVYYDGKCILCSREIAHYMKQVGADQIEFVDICGSKFDAAKEGVDPFAVHKIMHVRRPDASLATRVQAFIEIWKVLPKYNWLARVAEQTPVHAAMEVGYTLFATVRPWLPRRKVTLCEESPFCEI